MLCEISKPLWKPFCGFHGGAISTAAHAGRRSFASVGVSRLRYDSRLRTRFIRLLPRMIVAEWALGLSAFRYALKRPPLRR